MPSWLSIALREPLWLSKADPHRGGSISLHPEQKEAVVQLFRNAKRRRFEDWGRLNRIVESESREGK